MKQVSTQRVNSPGTSQHEDMEMGALHKTIRGEIQTHISGEAQLNAEISHKKILMNPDTHACRTNYYASKAFCFKFHLAAATRHAKLNSSEVAAFAVEMTLRTFSFAANNTAFFSECL